MLGFSVFMCLHASLPLQAPSGYHFEGAQREPCFMAGPSLLLNTQIQTQKYSLFLCVRGRTNDSESTAVGNRRAQWIPRNHSQGWLHQP